MGLLELDAELEGELVGLGVCCRYCLPSTGGWERMLVASGKQHLPLLHRRCRFLHATVAPTGHEPRQRKRQTRRVVPGTVSRNKHENLVVCNNKTNAGAPWARAGCRAANAVIFPRVPEAVKASGVNRAAISDKDTDVAASTHEDINSAAGDPLHPGSKKEWSASDRE